VTHIKGGKEAERGREEVAEEDIGKSNRRVEGNLNYSGTSNYGHSN
jgi:hypothetical protein